MIFESALVATPFALGKILDSYTTQEAKLKATSVLTRGQTLDWPKFVSRWSWWTYTRVYGAKSTSKRFIVGSLAFYVILCLATLPFLRVLFPTTYAEVVSVWTDGQGWEQFWWVVAMALGAPLYILANAQTLYFLEILKTSPNFFKFFLVAYADFLITASIALFGLPLLLLVYTYGAVNYSSGHVDLMLSFQNLVRSPAADTLYYINKQVKDSDLERIIRASDDAVWFEVKFEGRPNAELLKRDRDDRAIVVDAISQGIVDASIDKDGVIKLRDDAGTTTGYRLTKPTFEDRVTVFEPLNKDSLVKTRKRFCEKFPNGLKDDPGYIKPALTLDLKERISLACNSSQGARISVPVEINSENIDWSSQYRQFLFITLSDMVGNLTGGFKSYLALSPYAYLHNDDSSVWKHRHMLGEREDRAQIAFDEMLLEGNLYDAGSYNWFLNKTLAAGSINFAIMSTALFNILVMSLMFLLFPIAKFVGSGTFLTRWFSITESPFSIFGAAASVWIAVIISVFSVI